ncbi:hypothetical protein SK128_002943 [Halocaridina rubra]|uniref:Failed axon connections-like protein n=1 Tax=Halocaridina rubra TaxID=373956 RepID=A0AAN8WVU9_HALRR
MNAMRRQLNLSSVAMLQTIFGAFPQCITEFVDGSKYYIITAVAIAVTAKLGFYVQKQNRRKKWNAAGRDVVVVHTFPRGIRIPNLSPFALKLETYLRMADIKYVLDTSQPIGYKGKSPWITLNGEDIADSQLILEALAKKFNKNFSSHLTPEQLGVAQAMRVMAEEHYFWCNEIWMCLKDNFNTLLRGFPVPFLLSLAIPILKPLLARRAKNMVHANGLGRHTDQEVQDMTYQDLEALSAWLGKKDYCTGDKATEVDCAIFGLMAQLVWVSPDSPNGRKLREDCSNLIDYCNRMKEKFWPDWNDNLAKN